ncbi:MAG: response regulator, partial [Candidatus Sulfotelmatobacter sp.]
SILHTTCIAPGTRVVSFILPLFCLTFEEETRGRAMKVLVVEAEDAVLKATGVMLNKLGYEVGLAPNCNEALRIYSDEGPHDVVLIALKFLRSSSAGGAKFIDALRQKDPKQKIAFITASPVLKKPFSLQELDDFMGAFRRPARSRFG